VEGMAEEMGWKELWRGGGGRKYGGADGRGEENELQSNEGE